MQAQPLNDLLTSFYLFIENRYMQFAQAYQTLTSPLYYTPDPSLPPGYNGFSAPLKGWNADSGVSGALVIQNVSGSAGVLDRSSGIHIDYANGRVILPSSYGTGVSLTGTYSFKEVNIYQSNEDQAALITQGKFFRNPNYVYLPTSGVPPGEMVTPCILVDTLTLYNDAYQFGGLIAFTPRFTITVMAESIFQLNALMSVFMDCKYQYVPVLNTINDVVDGWGDTKPGQYNYNNVIQQFGQPGNLAYIREVRVSKVTDRVKANPLLFIGIADFEVEYVRQSPTNVSGPLN